MKTTRTKPEPCIYCKAVVDASTEIMGENTPEKGNVAICFYCGGICIYDAELNLVQPTLKELHELKSGPEWGLIKRARQIIREK